MKTLSAVVVLVLAATSFGAAINLGSATVGQGATALLPVTVSANGGFNGVTAYVGWYQDVPVDFEYDASWLGTVGQVGAGSTPLSYENGAGAYSSGLDAFTRDVSFGGTKAVNIVSDATDVLVGNVLINVPQDFPVGVYKVYVDGSDSALSSGDSLSGADVMATLTVTPEPVSLALLAIGGLVVARRRRHA